MNGRPESTEADPYYFAYIDMVTGDDAIRELQDQLDKYLPILSRISEEQSLHRYAPEKWSIRQLLNHISDTERAFAFRALCFSRGFDTPLPSYDPDIAAAGANADATLWTAHVEEFRRVRLATLSLFENLPAEAWMRTGIASGRSFSVRAVGFLIPGHACHHFEILRGKYLL
jgi:hypothetical protein